MTVWLLIAVLTLGPTPAPAELTRPEIKCMTARQYYPPANGFSTALADQLAYLNVNMTRIEMIAEADGTMNWCQWVHIVDKSAERGIKILGLIDYTTEQASNADEWATPAYRARFVARAQELVTYYHDRANPIRHWEIWNEQDLDLSGTGGPDYRIEPEPYALLLQDTYAAIKAIDPGATVIFGGLSPKGFYYSENYLEDFYNTTPMQQYYAANGAYPFDVVACHPYPETFNNPNPALANVLNTKIKSVMNAHGDRSKKVWLTEMGWNLYYLPGSNAQRKALQAQYLTDSYELVDTLVDPDPASAGLPPYVDKYFWFKWNDFSPVDQWGLVNDDGTRRPSYFAYRDLTETGPEPPNPNPDPGEFPPVAGTSDADLPYTDDGGQPLRVSGVDLINGVQPEFLAGGFHDVTVPPDHAGRLATLTDGLFGGNGATVVLADYALPSLHVRFTFAQPMDLSDLRVFAGHLGDTGNRAFISCDVIINGVLARRELRTGTYGQAPVGGDAVAVVRWGPQSGESFIAQGVTTFEVKFYCVSSVSGGFDDPWDPCIDPLLDGDGLGAAYVASVIKEIDLFGEPATGQTPTPTPTPTPAPTLTPTLTPTPIPTPTPDSGIQGWAVY